MPSNEQSISFTCLIRSARGNPFHFATVPPEVSRSHLRRGRITAVLRLGSSTFAALMEPDGKLAHWFVIPTSTFEHEALQVGQLVTFELSLPAHQPDPVLPEHFRERLGGSPRAMSQWLKTTTLAKIDWVHWMESAKQESTRRERAESAIDMLEHGKKRVCCFDASGFYSKALSCPEAEQP